MKRFTVFSAAIIFSLFISCEKTDLTMENPPTDETNNIDSTLIDSSLFTGLCIPPITVDTSKVKMQMKQEGNPYIPTANWACIIPNFFLGIDQLWVNGSIPPVFKVVTLMMPVDIEPGTYNLQLNSPYDARYTPSNDNNFTVDYGTLTITVHDKVNKHVEGGFEFTVTNLGSPVLPTVSFTDGCFQADY